MKLRYAGIGSEFVSLAIFQRAAMAIMAGSFFLALPANAFASCPDQAQAEAMAEKWEKAEPIRGLPAGLNMDEAICMRDEMVKVLQRRLGRVIGYKAGLTSKAVQQRFGYDQPVRGVLLANMLQAETRDILPAAFGARPVVEADLLVEVRDESINEARTHLEALKALARIIPFIELPDLTIAEGEPVTGPIITAINVGARQGVFGLHPVPVAATQAFADMLAGMRVVVTDAGGKTLSDSPGTAILGHPLNAVLWLIDDLRRSGIRLRAGDILSLGTFSPPLPARAATTVTVRYIGLPGNPEVAVRFR